MHFELGDGGGHSGWEEAEQRHRDQPTYEERNDWAVALLHLGQTRQAVEVFERQVECIVQVDVGE